MSQSYPQVYVHIVSKSVQVSVMDRGVLKKQFAEQIERTTDAMLAVTRYITRVNAEIEKAHPGHSIPWKIIADDLSLVQAFYGKREIPDDVRYEWEAIRGYCKNHRITVVHVRNIPAFQARSAAPEPPKPEPEPVKRIIFHEPKRPEVIEFRNIPTEAELPQPAVEQLVLI
jgi:hypothetical protein